MVLPGLNGDGTTGIRMLPIPLPTLPSHEYRYFKEYLGKKGLVFTYTGEGLFESAGNLEQAAPSQE
jgi:hypothetical protein